MNSTRTAVICARDSAVLEQQVADAGFEVVGVNEFAVQAEHLVRHFTPDVVIVEQAIGGISGIESLQLLHAASPTSLLLLVVSDDWEPDDLGDTGAFDIITRSELADLASELGLLDEYLANRSDPNDRRRGKDRRVAQDWSKVGWERRKAQRRAEAPTNSDAAPEGDAASTGESGLDGGDADVVASG